MKDMNVKKKKKLKPIWKVLIIIGIVVFIAIILLYFFWFLPWFEELWNSIQGGKTPIDLTKWMDI